MAEPFTVERRVAFSETDMAGIVHFAHFFRWMEEAEHAFFRSLGLSIHTRIGDETYGWPRVHTECDFEAPLRFEEVFQVSVTIRAVGSKSIVWDFDFTRQGPDGPQRIARGSTTTACVRGREEGGFEAVEIPDTLREKLQAHQA